MQLKREEQEALERKARPFIEWMDKRGRQNLVAIVNTNGVFLQKLVLAERDIQVKPLTRREDLVLAHLAMPFMEWCLKQDSFVTITVTWAGFHVREQCHVRFISRNWIKLRQEMQRAAYKRRVQTRFRNYRQKVKTQVP